MAKDPGSAGAHDATPRVSAPSVDDLRSVLERSRQFGFLGPGPIETPQEHGHGFYDVALRTLESPEGLEQTPPGLPAGCVVLDLGSGGGVPGFVGVVRFPNTINVLLDAQAKRIAFLKTVVEEWAVGDRVRVVHGRAEDLARTSAAGSVDLITARGFGPPATTAECAARFLRVGGILIVSEPPDSQGERWQGLDNTDLGMSFLGVEHARSFGYAVIRKTARTPARYPRVAQALAKRLLF
jgi:16S rRNA (guanine527-N7)-methyltransferase